MIRLTPAKEFEKAFEARAFAWWHSDSIGRLLHRHKLPVVMAFGPRIDEQLDTILHNAYAEAKQDPVSPWEIKEGVLIPEGRHGVYDALRKAMHADIDPRLALWVNDIAYAADHFALTTVSGHLVQVRSDRITTEVPTRRFTREDAAAMVQAALAQGWKAIHIEADDPEIRNMLWIEAKRSGLEVRGVVVGPEVQRQWREELHLRRLRELQAALSYLAPDGPLPEARDRERLRALVDEALAEQGVVDVIEEFEPELLTRLRTLKAELEASPEQALPEAAPEQDHQAAGPSDPFARLAAGQSGDDPAAPEAEATNTGASGSEPDPFARMASLHNTAPEPSPSLDP